MIVNSQLTPNISYSVAATFSSTAECTEILNGTFTITNEGNSKFRKFDCSKVSSSSTIMPSGSTKTRVPRVKTNGSRDGKPPTDCFHESDRSVCLRFVDKHSSFYLKIGGWLMLGIVLAGIMVLAVTHVLGIRNMRRPQQRQLSRILWVEAVTKSRLARFV